MNKKILVLVLAVVVAGGVWALFYRSAVSPTVQVPADWKYYSSDNGGFSIKYDPTLTLEDDVPNSSTRFYKLGPTQKGETEMYDGIIFSIRRISVTDGGQSYIDGQIQQFKEVGTITRELHDSNLNGIPTKEYSASGLGDFEIIFVPVDSTTLLEIAYMTPDPTNAGFRATVEMIGVLYESSFCW
jgi:hypothetical protein